VRGGAHGLHLVEGAYNNSPAAAAAATTTTLLHLPPPSARGCKEGETLSGDPVRQSAPVKGQVSGILTIHAYMLQREVAQEATLNIEEGGGGGGSWGCLQVLKRTCEGGLLMPVMVALPSFRPPFKS
jgi:hypothetical protein